MHLHMYIGFKKKKKAQGVLKGQKIKINPEKQDHNLTQIEEDQKREKERH